MGILPYRGVEAGVLGERHASDLKQVRVKRQKSKTASPSVLLGLQGPKEEEEKKGKGRSGEPTEKQSPQLKPGSFPAGHKASHGWYQSRSSLDPSLAEWPWKSHFSLSLFLSFLFFKSTKVG